MVTVLSRKNKTTKKQTNRKTAPRLWLHPVVAAGPGMSFLFINSQVLRTASSGTAGAEKALPVRWGRPRAEGSYGRAACGDMGSGAVLLNVSQRPGGV